MVLKAVQDKTVVRNFEWLKNYFLSADLQANPSDISWQKVAFLVIQNHALLFLSWTAFINITLLKFVFSEKATHFCRISTVDFSYVITVKTMVVVSHNFVAFSEYMNLKV